MAPLRWLPPPTSAFTLQSQWRSEVGDYRWVDWGRISPHAAIAVVPPRTNASLTTGAWTHKEIRNAVQERIEYGRVRGASTITQQVANKLYLWPGRSWLRKALEAQLAVTIELLLLKRWILEVYLNVA